MMSADLITEIKISGTQDEFKAILHVIRYFENEKYEHYKKKRDCAYIERVRISSKGKSSHTKDMSDNEIKAFISECGNTVNVEANGPFGVYYMLEEVGLFEAMADAAPTAVFTGTSDGYITGATVALKGELLKGYFIYRIIMRRMKSGMKMCWRTLRIGIQRSYMIQSLRNMCNTKPNRL